MSACVSDFVKIVVLAACANAFLAGRCRGVRPLFSSEEYVLELIHACIDEQKGRILCGNKR
jgi:hypothetical protein